jgi:hypothetical protein
MDYIHYPELIEDGYWGKDEVLLKKDVNLLNCDFEDSGYCLIDLDEDISKKLNCMVQTEIYNTTGKTIELEKYHASICEEEHTQILNTMPYKMTKNEEFLSFGKQLEKWVSSRLGEPVKIFNEDLWVRICRPSSFYSNDFNPCHRDIYLDFYRNTVNIYAPICGSNEHSSLTIQPGSHLWNENETCITKGGAYFKSIRKKYSVDAIVASKRPLQMIRPNPSLSQILLFSPYLIHGCANNDNVNITRISLEVRFIRDNANGRKQEEEFNTFLRMRNWR